MTSIPSLPARIEKMRWHIEYWKSRNLNDHAQEMCDVLATLQQHEQLLADFQHASDQADTLRDERDAALQQHERLEAVVTAARDLLRYAGIKHPGADHVIVSRERVHTLESALAALDSAAPVTPADTELALSREDVAENSGGRR